MEDKKQRILLVDDSNFSLDKLERALCTHFDIIKARNGAEGLVLLEKNEVDLIITDLLMPQISGLAFLGQVKRHNPSMKTIVCSADVQEATKKKARAIGAAAFLGKPIDPDEVRSVVNLVLSHKVAPRDLPIAPKYSDAFTEIFNIGVGKAADSLSKLVFDTVRLSVPKLEILTPQQLAQQVQESFSDEIACIRQEFRGTTSGRAYLLLSAASGANLVNALVRQSEQETQILSEADREMLIEVGNILINALVGTLANTLDIDFNFGQAICNVMKIDDVHEQLILGDSQFVLYVETLFVVPGRQIGGNLAILLGADGMDSITSRMEEMM